VCFCEPTINIQRSFQARPAMKMRSAIFWDFTQRRMEVSWRRFETIHFQGSNSPIISPCPETSVQNCHS